MAITLRRRSQNKIEIQWGMGRLMKWMGLPLCIFVCPVLLFAVLAQGYRSRVIEDAFGVTRVIIGPEVANIQPL